MLHHCSMNIDTFLDKGNSSKAINFLGSLLAKAHKIVLW